MPAPMRMLSPVWYPVLQKWAMRQPRMVLVAGALALLLLIWALYIPPVYAIRRLGQQWDHLKAELEQDRQVLDTAQRRRILPLPSIEALPRVLEQLHAQARKSKVAILSVSPAKASPAGSNEPMILPVELQVEGEYRALGQFLGSLRSQPLLGVVTVRQVGMGREERFLPRLRAQLSIEMALGSGTDGNR